MKKIFLQSDNFYFFRFSEVFHGKLILQRGLTFIFFISFYSASLAQQNVFNRDNSGTGNWGDGALPWFYQTSNNNQGDPDNVNSVRNDVFIGHNNNTTMTLNGRYYIHRDFTFQSAASSARTLNNSGGGGFSFTRSLINAANTINIFNTPVAIDANAAEIRLDNASGGGLTFSGSVFTNSNQTFIRFNNGNTGTITLGGAMTQTGSFVKQNGGTLIFTGSADFSGSLFIDEGKVGIGRNMASNVIEIGGGVIGTTSFNATLELFNGGTTVSKSITVRNFNSTGGSREILFSHPASTIATISGTLALEKTVAITNSNTNNGAVISNNITGIGGITKNGTGLLTLTGNANTYSGLTTVNSGTLQLNRSGGTTIPVTNNVTISGGTLQVSTNQTVNNLILSSGTLTVDASTTLTINGTFTGGGTIINNGTIILVGPSTFPGAATTITTMNDLQINRISGVVLDQSMVIAGTLTLTSGALSIGSNTLTLNGAVSGSGSLSGSSTSNLVIGGTALNQTLNFTSGSRILKDLTLSANATATLGTPLEITAGTAPSTSGTVIVNSGAALASAGNLTIKSNEFGTARVGNSAGTITGNVTVERFIKLRTPGTGPGTGNNGRAYRLLAPTVNTSGSIRDNWMETGLNSTIGSNHNPLALHGTQITGAGGNGNGFDVTATNAPSLYSTTNGVTPTYTAIGSTSGTLNALTGYFLYIRGDRSMDMTIPLAPGMPTSSTTLRTKGTLLTGDQSFTSTLSTGDGIMNLVTNPYASPISWSSIYTDAINPNTNLKNYYTLWDPNVGSRGGFVTVTDGGGVSILNGQTGPSLANINIQPGQAFFVTSDGASAPTLTIRESYKSAVNNNNVFLVPPESFSVNLFFNEPSSYRRIADGASVFYDNTYTPGLDGNDALEISNWDENIAIARDGKHLAIESRPVIITKDTLPLFMNNMKEQTYEFEFTPAQFTNIGLKAELIDSFTNTRSLLSVVNATVVPFTVTADPASKATNRFMVVFGPQAPLAIDVLTISVQAKYQPAAQGGNGVEVNWTAKTEKDMDRYELERSFNGTGFTKITTVLSAGNSSVPVNYNWLDATPQTGNNFYRIKAIDKSGLIKYTDVVKVSFGKANPAISANPNPVNGNSFTLQLTGIEKGTYNLQIYNKLGQVVYSSSIQHAGGTASVTVKPGHALAKGIYELLLTGDRNIRISNRIVKN